MYNDLREFLAELKKRNELVEITKEVDTKFEIGDVCRRVNDVEGPALLFRNVKAHSDWTVVTNVLGTLNRLALALETPSKQMVTEYCERIKEAGMFGPVIISREKAPCKEVIKMGPEVNLNEIPIPIWHPGDGGPYISVGVQITKDPDSGVRNASIVRQMVQRRDQLGILLLPGKHTAIHFRKKEKTHAPLDIAVAIGVDPVIEIMGCHKGPLEEDEFAVAGALRRKKIELVKCETVDLEVPATAELVIEGQLLPGEPYPEGPFGEFTGTLGPATDNNPPMKVTCITHRRNPIYQGLYVGKTPNEDGYLGALTISASILAKARRNCPGLVAYAKSPYGPGTLWGIAAIKKTHPGHAKEAIGAIWKTQPSQNLSEAFMRFLVIVDDDINVHDLKEVTWAISTRCRPERDIFLERDGGVGISPLATDSGAGFSGRVMMDATEKWEEEGNVQRQKLINHWDSPYWKELNEKGLSRYLGVDMSMWEKEGH